MDNIIIGRNAVMEAIENDHAIDKIMVAKGSQGSIGKVLAKAKSKGLVVQNVDKKLLDKLAEGRPHQGIAAQIAAYQYGEMEDIFRIAKAKQEDPFVIILDGIEDPHNLGAIMRSAECAGAHGIIIPKRHSAGLTEVVAKASAGAIEYMPCVKVTNIAQTIEQMKKDGFWIAACDMGEHMYYEQNLTGPIAVVIGSEGFGISKLVKEKCDYVVSIPMRGHITSLNASNAAAILMYEIRRQRDEGR
ncbi:MAG: 23S rRNA (guanosine(2251)-2'-O)-methyltransferase RlmB [Clostridia bacterium]|nr:23S rRNA (guanosine(2251)-2'-O)-methyltransferase RlmB [Clostridia bacterium]